MKVTPLDIRQKTFEKTLRGYDKDEVNAFLLSLSQEWERVQDESKEIRIKLEATEREVTKLREVESSLYKTLKTAEDTGANVIEQAHKTAELHLREMQLNAEAILNEARSKAKDTLEMAESTAGQMLEDMEEQLKQLVQSYKTAASVRDSLIGDLRRMANELLEKAERIKGAVAHFDADHHLQVARREGKQILNPNADPRTSREGQTEKKQEGEAETLQQKSFFDDIQ